MDKEYAAISGIKGFVDASIRLAYGPELFARLPIAATQSISGTGALRVGAAFLSRFHSSKTILVPTPTWGNHGPIFKDGGLNVGQYRYFDTKTNGLDFQGNDDILNLCNLQECWKTLVRQNPIPSSFFMHVHIIQLVSIQHQSNGRSFMG